MACKAWNQSSMLFAWSKSPPLIFRIGSQKNGTDVSGQIVTRTPDDMPQRVVAGEDDRGSTAAGICWGVSSNDQKHGKNWIIVRAIAPAAGAGRWPGFVVLELHARAGREACLPVASPGHRAVSDRTEHNPWRMEARRKVGDARRERVR